MFKIQIAADNSPVGNSSLVLASIVDADDFAIRSDGTLFMAINSYNYMGVVLLDNSTALQTVAGSVISTILEKVGASRFGRLETDTNVLYLLTSGGEFFPCTLDTRISRMTRLTES
jgi:hypothetical protein